MKESTWHSLQHPEHSPFSKPRRHNLRRFATVGELILVTGLKLYYQIHGSGELLVVLHGGLMTIGLMKPLVTALAESRQVIAVEPEGHGGTPLRGERLSFE